MFAESPALFGWSPWSLGSSLLAAWDAEHVDLMVTSGGAVSSWTDAVQGIALTQATGAQMPIYDPASLNGHPGVTFDGVDDYLRGVGTFASLPSGSIGGEFWFVADQQALGSDTATRDFASIGNTAAADTRRANGAGISGTFRARTVVGNGTSGVTHTNSVADGFGKHVFRYVVTSTQEWAEIDGVAGTATAVVPNTGTNRVSLGSSATAGGAAFGKCILGLALFTALLNADQATQLYAYMNRRL